MNLMDDRNFKIIFISDMHLVYDSPFLGIDTYASFKSVVDDILNNHSDLDYLIVGGDLVQDQKRESFLYFKKQINKINSPKLYVRGNHDIDDKFYSSLDIPNQIISLGMWEIIRLDTYSEGNIYGEVQISDLEKIINYSKNLNNKQLVLYMHHNLFLTHSPWLDIHITKNRKEILSLISKIKNLNFVLNGHIHQETFINHKQIDFFSSPSTSIQFTSNEPKFKLDNISPGYLVVELKKEGNKKITCERVSGDYGIPEINPKSY